MNLHLLIIIVSLLLVSCANEKTSRELSAPPLETISSALDLPNNTMSKSELNYNPNTSIWSFNHEVFSGHSVSFYKDSTLKEKFGILNGKKQHVAASYYPDGHLKSLANYHKGKLYGIKKVWSSDSSHIIISHMNFIRGKAHGIQKKWYATGEIFKIRNLNMGREEGIQQAFRKNGVLYANYEAKNGRIFGLKKAALCFELEDENIRME